MATSGKNPLFNAGYVTGLQQEQPVIPTTQAYDLQSLGLAPAPQQPMQMPDLSTAGLPAEQPIAPAPVQPVAPAPVQPVAAPIPVEKTFADYIATKGHDPKSFLQNVSWDTRNELLNEYLTSAPPGYSAHGISPQARREAAVNLSKQWVGVRPEANIVRDTADVLIDIAEGVTQGGNALLGLLPTSISDRAGKGAQIHDAYDAIRSNQALDEQMRANEVRAKSKAEGDSGFVTGLKGVAVAPLSFLTNAAGSSIPVLAATAVNPVAGISVAAGMGVGGAKTNRTEEINNASKEDLLKNFDNAQALYDKFSAELPPDQAEAATREAVKEWNPKALVGLGVAGAGAAIEALVLKGLTKFKAGSGVAKKLESPAGIIVGEGTSGAVEQVGQNIASEDTRVALSRGVAQAFTEEALGGSPFAVARVFQKDGSPANPEDPPKDTLTDTDKRPAEQGAAAPAPLKENAPIDNPVDADGQKLLDGLHMARSTNDVGQIALHEELLTEHYKDDAAQWANKIIASADEELLALDPSNTKDMAEQVAAYANIRNALSAENVTDHDRVMQYIQHTKQNILNPEAEVNTDAIEKIQQSESVPVQPESGTQVGQAQEASISDSVQRAGESIGQDALQAQESVNWRKETTKQHTAALQEMAYKNVDRSTVASPALVNASRFLTRDKPDGANITYGDILDAAEWQVPELATTKRVRNNNTNEGYNTLPNDVTLYDITTDSTTKEFTAQLSAAYDVPSFVKPIIRTPAKPRKKKRTVEAPREALDYIDSVETNTKSKAMGTNDDPLMFNIATPEKAKRINARARLKKANELFDSNQLDTAQYTAEVRSVYADLQDKLDSQEYKDLKRGQLHIMTRLTTEANKGTIDDEVPAMFWWLSQQNPDMVKDLAVSISTPKSDLASGYFNEAQHLIKLFKHTGNQDTIIHEVLHSTERLMPMDVQRAITDEWLSAYEKAMVNIKDPDHRVAVHDMVTAVMGGDTALLQSAVERLGSKAHDYYHLAGPSEFWAVKGTSILTSRYDAESIWAKAAQWMREFVQHMRGVLGLRSDAPVLKALDAVMRSNGLPIGQTLIRQFTGDALLFNINNPDGTTQTKTVKPNAPEFKPAGKPRPKHMITDIEATDPDRNVVLTARLLDDNIAWDVTHIDYAGVERRKVVNTYSELSAYVQSAGLRIRYRGYGNAAPPDVGIALAPIDRGANRVVEALQGKIPDTYLRGITELAAWGQTGINIFLRSQVDKSMGLKAIDALLNYGRGHAKSLRDNLALMGARLNGELTERGSVFKSMFDHLVAIQNTLKNTGLKKETVSDAIHSLGAKHRVEVMGLKSGFGFKDKSGKYITDEDGSKFREEYKDLDWKVINEVHSALQAREERTQKLMLASGTMALSTYNAFSSAANKGWISLRTIKQDKNFLGYMFKAFGRSSKADDPMAVTLLSQEARVRMAMANRAKLEFVNFVRSINHPRLSEFVTFTTEELGSRLTGKKLAIDDAEDGMEDHSEYHARLLHDKEGEINDGHYGYRVVYMLDGKPKSFIIRNPDMAEFYKKHGDLNAAFNLMSHVTKLESKALTTVNPKFVLKTLLMWDPITAFINAQGAFGKTGKDSNVNTEDANRFGISIIKNAFKHIATGGTIKHAFNPGEALKDPVEDALFRFYKHGGGGIQFNSKTDIDTMLGAPADALAVDVLRNSAGRGSVVKLLDKAGQFMHSFEDGVRYGAFKTFVEYKNGGKFNSEADLRRFILNNPGIYQQALVGSKRITTNFEQRGSDQYMSSVIPFWNPAMQGIFGTLPSIMSSPHGRRSAAFIAAIAALALVADAEGEDDDELGVTKALSKKALGKSIVIGNAALEMPPEMRAIVAVTQASVGTAFLGMDGADAMKLAMAGLESSLFPFRVTDVAGGTDENIANRFMHTVSPAMGWMFTNKDYFGKDIMAKYVNTEDGEKLTNAPDYLRGRPQDSDEAKWAAQFIYDNTGLDVAPYGFDHMTGLAFGWITQSIKSMENPDKPAIDAILPSVYTEADGYNIVNKYNDLTYKISQEYATTVARPDLAVTNLLSTERNNIVEESKKKIDGLTVDGLAMSTIYADIRQAKRDNNDSFFALRTEQLKLLQAKVREIQAEAILDVRALDNK